MSYACSLPNASLRLTAHTDGGGEWVERQMIVKKGGQGSRDGGLKREATRVIDAKQKEGPESETDNYKVSDTHCLDSKLCSEVSLCSALPVFSSTTSWTVRTAWKLDPYWGGMAEKLLPQLHRTCGRHPGAPNKPCTWEPALTVTAGLLAQRCPASQPLGLSSAAAPLTRAGSFRRSFLLLRL